MPKTSQKSEIIAGLCEKYLLDVVMADLSDDDDKEQINEMFLSNVASLFTNRRSIHLAVSKSNKGHQNVLKKLDDRRFNQMIRVRPEEFVHILNLIKDNDVFNTKPANFSDGGYFKYDWWLPVS